MVKESSNASRLTPQIKILTVELFLPKISLKRIRTFVLTLKVWCPNQLKNDECQYSFNKHYKSYVFAIGFEPIIDWLKIK